MENLPIEIFLDIFSRLPITSLINVKCVCRSWRSFTRHPLLAAMHFSRTAENGDPCLLLLSQPPSHHHHLYSLHFSASGDTQIESFASVPVPMVPKFLLMGSCNGLLYLQSSLDEDISYIYNPFTRDCMELPRSEHFGSNRYRVAVGFGYSLKQYKVVRVVYYRNEDDDGAGDAPVRRRYALLKSEVQVLTVDGNGSLGWRRKGETIYQLIGKPSQALVNGRLHWLTCSRRYESLRKLISFDLTDEQFREVATPASFGRHCTQLVNLRGYLSGVVQGFRNIYVWVMKQYGVKETWIKEFTIGVRPRRELGPLASARVLCLLKNGDVLLEDRSRTLFCYTPNCGQFKELKFQGLPELFSTFVHIGSFNRVDTPILH